MSKVMSVRALEQDLKHNPQGRQDDVGAVHVASGCSRRSMLSNPEQYGGMSVQRASRPAVLLTSLVG